MAKRKAKAKPKSKTPKPAPALKVKKPHGRPSKFTKAIADSICEKLAEGRTLRDVCRDEGMPSEATVRTWALDDVGAFSAQYARAREIGYLSMADEILDIADDRSGDEKVTERGETVLDNEFMGRSRLKVDTRKWLLSKALPKVFGDKVAVTGADGGAVKTESTLLVVEVIGGKGVDEDQGTAGTAEDSA